MPTDYRNRAKVSGEVTKLRLDTADVMACIDAAEKGGVVEPGMSLAQVIKWGIVVMAQTLREAGVLPEHSPFDYHNVTAKYRQADFGHKMKASIKMDAQEVNMKVSERSVAMPLTPDNHTNVEDSGLVLPPEVKRMVTCGPHEVGVITRRLRKHDENVTTEDVAKWLLYSPARTAATSILDVDQLASAETLIRGIWPQYPSVLDY